jgi:hypothetical protein
MFSSIQRKVVLWGALLMTTALLGSKATAATIYSQTFTGGSSTLAGTTSTTGGGTWAGGNILDLNGNTYATPGINGAVSLPFTPSSGFVYDLSATISMSPADNWLGVGFLQDNGVYGFLPPPSSPNTPTALRRNAGGGDQGWELYPGASTGALTSNNVLVRLDTTGAQWKTSFFQGGTQIGSTYTYTSGNPTINYVGFVMEGAGSGVTGNVSAFQLTAVPEPSTYALLVAGGVGSLLMFRRRRA